MKTCSSCKQALLLQEFYVGRGQCKQCIARACAGYYQKNRQTINARIEVWRRENRHRVQQTNVQYRKRLRQDVLNHYGSRCACCGESTVEFLGIDHINGGGRLHRRELAAEGMTLYLWLRKNGYPSGFQVLCFNCNLAKGFFGYCPHSTTVKNSRQVVVGQCR